MTNVIKHLEPVLRQNLNTFSELRSRLLQAEGVEMIRIRLLLSTLDQERYKVLERMLGSQRLAWGNNKSLVA